MEQPTTTITLPVSQEEVDWLEAKGFVRNTSAFGFAHSLLEWCRKVGEDAQYITLSLPTKRAPRHSFSVYVINGLGLHLVMEHAEGYRTVYAAYATAELRGWRRVT